MADILYNYAGMEACIGEMTQIHATAVALKMTGIAHRESLRGTWTGNAHMSFDDAFQRYLNVNERVEEASQRVIQALSTGTSDMQACEMQQCQVF
ncbi:MULTISPECIES: WXG100 family type VII secretion target [Mycobacterium]|uniref:ESAT-6-like protein n=2 Tax=Mycobacterium TaxID=1763 RepID=A0A7Z7NB95_9MYCO|nr:MULTISPECIES: WXG100 family type VII secretion target [Mycobacterium]MCV7145591.1 WXG100 family type VII secretion target [Mycobacterium riyadhense]ORW79579.1 hypothetical protein AWC22_18765 [Mycobacterium riyadhense]SOJ55696.1 hypothetical protein MSIMFB_03177 [Mycobacterium simulans]SON61870.1 hypothetical protein MSIMFI_03389 [Mycobacterium simulans]VTO99591.1 Proteins of 100 residues with WXG [Mycobacterium riyadhense]